MKANPFQSSHRDIELGHLPLRDAAQPLSDAPTPAAVSPQPDAIVVQSAAGRAKKALLAGIAVGGTLLGGGLVAAVAVPALQRQRSHALAQRDAALGSVHAYQAILSKRSALNAWVDAQLADEPDWDDTEQGASSAQSASAAVGYAACVAPEFESFEAAPITEYDRVPEPGAFDAPGPLFNGALPRAGDMSLALRNDSNFFNNGVHALLESLVGMRPEYLAANLRREATLANGTRMFANRVFERDTQFGAPKQLWFSTPVTAHSALGTDVAVWPLVAQRASQMVRAQGAADSQDRGIDASFGDRLSAIALSGSPLEALALNAWVEARSTADPVDMSDADAFANKDDNIPFMVDMLRVNPLVFGAVEFTSDAVALLPQNVTTLSDGSVVRRSSDLKLSIEPAGKAPWTVETDRGFFTNSAQYSIVGTHADGLSLRRATDGPDVGSRFLSYDAMSYAASRLIVGRIHCGEQKLLVS